MKKQPRRSSQKSKAKPPQTKPVAKTVDTKKKVEMAVSPMQVFAAEEKAARGTLRKLTLDGFDNFVSRLGLNNDNTLSAGTYEFNLVTRNRVKLEAAYRGSWITGKVVDSVAEDMTRAGVDVTTNEGEENLEDLEHEMTKLQIWQSLCSLIKWGRLYGGAIGVLQIEGQDLSTPIQFDTIAKHQFKGIAVFDRWQINPVLTPVITVGPDLGLPVYYQIVNNPTSLDPEAATATGQLTVHHSRVIRYTGIDLPYFQAITEMMWGESVLERLWDRLISFDNASLSSAQLIDRANLRTVGIEGLREIISAGGEAQEGLLAQFDMMRQLQTNEGITLLDKNDTFASVAYSFAGLSDMMLQQGQQLSGACDIPLVRLFCQSPAGLNATGDSDIRMYYDNVNAQQEAKLRRPFGMLLKVLWRSTFGAAAPKDMDFSFTPLWQMSASDKAVVAKSNAETITGVYEAGLISRHAAMMELRTSSGDTGIFSNITDEEIKEAENDPAPMPDAAIPGLKSANPAEPDPDKEAKPAESVKTGDTKIGRVGRWLFGY